MAGRMTGAFWAALILALFLCGAGTAPRALAQGATDYPIPSNAREAYGPIFEGFVSPIEPREHLKGTQYHVDQREEALKAQRAARLPTAPAFIRDTDLRVYSPTYLFDED